MIENQGELRSALQINREQKELIKQLEKEQTSGQEGSPGDTNEQLLTQVEAGKAAAKLHQTSPGSVTGLLTGDFLSGYS